MYGIEAVSIKAGKKGIEIEPRSGRPSTSITPDNIERVLQMILTHSSDFAPSDLFLFP
ncbi:hypothetical protein C0J52_04442 [Blattella germanica]|nr:hypothetical protein C0J52_04442 [Blattella germanica]